MDDEAQKAGEARVQALLIDELIGLGLVKPSGMKVDVFDKMLTGLRQKLAYMTDSGLEALAEEVGKMGQGPNKDRFPIATVILGRAAKIEPPEDSASPLIRKVFAHGVGRDAIREGWAPELLSQVRKHRLWPNDFVVKQCRDQAVQAVRQMRDLDDRLERGETIAAEQVRWRDNRLAQVRKCEAIAAMAQDKGQAA